MATAGKSVKPRVQKVRRIVTGLDKKGRSIIASDKPSPHVMALQGIPTFGVFCCRTSSLDIPCERIILCVDTVKDTILYH